MCMPEDRLVELAGFVNGAGSELCFRCGVQRELTTECRPYDDHLGPGGLVAGRPRFGRRDRRGRRCSAAGPRWPPRGKEFDRDL